MARPDRILDMVIPRVAAIEGDDLAHLVAPTNPLARGKAGPVTDCGRPVLVVTLDQPDDVQHGAGCHLCIPDKAHPLAPIWWACRRWDDNAEAALARS